MNYFISKTPLEPSWNLVLVGLFLFDLWQGLFLLLFLFLFLFLFFFKSNSLHVKAPWAYGKGWPLAMDSLKFDPSSPCPTLLRHAGWPPLKRPQEFQVWPVSGVVRFRSGPFQEWPACRLGNLRPSLTPFGHPTPYALCQDTMLWRLLVLRQN
jgi:hypothetical protein